MKPTVIDLFAGVGGLSLGFEMQGFHVVLANEYDESIAMAYIENHKNTKMVIGDITKLNLEEVFGSLIGKVDVIIGGPPCQGFSQKGQRKSVLDPRNFLFKYYDAVVKLIEVECKMGKDIRKPVSHAFTDENGEFVFGPLCANRLYEVEIWVNNVKHAKICTECHHKGECLKGVDIDCKKDWKPDCKEECKEEHKEECKKECRTDC